MKNIQQNLLIVLAIGLCGLCAWQWYFQTVQRDQIDKLDQMIYKQSAEIQGHTNSIAGMAAEIAGQQARINDLKQKMESNEVALVNQERENLRLQVSRDAATNEIAQYQSLTNLLAARLMDAYDGVKKQNAAISNLVAERDEFVGKYNASVKSRNELVEKYNDLVLQVKKLQDAANSNGGK